MSRFGWRTSWLVIAASLAFMAGYLVRYGRPAAGQSAASLPQTAPVAAPALAVAVPGQPALPPPTATASPAPTASSPSAAGPKAAPSQPGSKTPPAPVAETQTQPPSAPQTPPPAAPAPAPAPTPQSPPPPDAPFITFPETVYDFGALYQDQEVSHDYAFTNTGKSLLTITRVTSSCGCTAAMPSKKEFAPGESGSIKVTFKSGRYRDRVTKHVTVDSTDPVQPRVSLTLTGIVKSELDVVPSGIYIGSLRLGESTERSVTLSPVEVKKFAILEVKSDDPLVRVSTPKPGPADKPGSYQLQIQFGPAEKVGRLNAVVTVRTDLPHTKDVRIAVFGRIVEKEPPSAETPAQP